jgi:hypothetical protein
MVIVLERNGDWIRPFQGAGPKCPKCLSVDVATNFHSATIQGYCHERFVYAQQMSDPDTPVTDHVIEHLCRGCMACGHTWSEHTADAIL